MGTARVGFSGMAAVCGAVSLLSLFGSPVLPESLRFICVYGALAVLLFGLCLSRERSSRDTRKWLISLVLLVFLLLLSTAFQNPAAVIYYICLFGVYVLGALHGARMKFQELQGLKMFALCAGFVQTLLAGYEALGNPPLIGGYGRYADGTSVLLENPLLPFDSFRVTGSLGHPIPFSLAVLLCLAVLHTSNAPVRRPSLKFFLTVWFATFLVLSGTRSAVLCLLVLGLLKGITRVGAWPTRIVYILASTAGISILANILGRASSNIERTGSYTNRSAALQAVPGLLDRPFLQTLIGNGLGSEDYLRSIGLLQRNGFNVVDNQWVTTLASGGIACLLILALILALKTLSSQGVVATVVLAFLYMGFVFDFLRWPSVSLYLFVFVSLSVQANHPPGQGPMPRSLV
ncbi:hypothetical protein [Quadrisphaera granulorum]|uniref:hypothetical protein n=1 Tax=Quadrisphaera granulorum TaxID=317664 RepID=UPI0011B3A06B|nr:hypothetical protein [Quadrisphaera granulorum]